MGALNICLGVFLLGAAVQVQYIIDQNTNMLSHIPQAVCPAERCNTAACKLPECFCSGNDTMVENDMTKPQIVYLTFDDALSNLASTQFYEALFGTPTNHTYSNPNGCAIR